MLPSAADAPVPDSDPLTLISLPPLMSQTRGIRDLRIGLIDGHVLATHPDFSGARIEFVSGQPGGRPTANDPASDHATAVAGILVANRGSGAPGICPEVILLVRPIFRAGAGPARNTGVDQLASAIVELTDSHARIINISLVLGQRGERYDSLRESLDYACYRGVIVVAAAGNQGMIGGSVITRHRSVIPVVAYDLDGHPARYSNLGHSIGRRGVGATGDGIVSLGVDGGLRPFGGTSAAAAVVTGTIALLWSEFPQAPTEDLAFALSRSTSRQPSVAPPLLNAWRAYEILRATQTAKGCKDGRRASAPS